MKRITTDNLRLYLVTDRRMLHGRNLEDVVSEAVAGGVTMVQLREKEASTREFIDVALKLKKILSIRHIPLIINDRVDVALATDADGVHIGQSDMPYESARRLLGPNKIIGLSVEDIAEIDIANKLDIDYVGISPVFATPTKNDTASPFGLEGLRKAIDRSSHPAVGIGGMNADTAGAVIRCGADGIAVVSAIMDAPDARAAASHLSEIIRRASDETR